MSNTEFWGILMDSLSTVLAAIAIFIYIFFWIKDKTSSNYDVFDAIYLDILKIGMDKPAFRNIEKTQNYKEVFVDEGLIQYEIYAFISWNFVETIFDKSDDELLVTWGPAIKYEASLHKEWMKDPINKVKFKESFYNFALTL